MAYKIPNCGKNIFLSHILSIDMKLHLYQSVKGNVSSSTVLDDITESSQSGYVSILLNSSNWSISGGLASYAQQTFTFSEAASVLGYYLTDADDQTLLMVNVLDDIYELPFTGGTVKVTPKLIIN